MEKKKPELVCLQESPQHKECCLRRVTDWQDKMKENKQKKNILAELAEKKAEEQKEKNSSSIYSGDKKPGKFLHPKSNKRNYFGGGRNGQGKP